MNYRCDVFKKKIDVMSAIYSPLVETRGYKIIDVLS